MEPVVAISIIAALVIGIAAGWVLASRIQADLKERLKTAENESKETDSKYLRTFADLEAAKERIKRADDVEQQLENARADRERLGAELATFRANADNFEEQKRLLVQAREDLLKEFRLTGSEVLGKAQEQFLKNATERFGSAEKANKDAVAALLEPVNQRLKSYEEQVAVLETKRQDAFGQLTGLIAAMRDGQEQVRAEAARLGNSLRSAPKASGRWGELQVENVLEKCGLSPHTDYASEASITTEDGRLRPDFIVDIPGNKKLIIDAKNIWADYDRAYSTDDVEAREKALDAHVSAVKSHIVALSSKAYYSHWEGSAEYVVLFIPGEHLLYSALSRDEQLWNFAFDKNVLLATPTNLVAIAKTVARVWQHVNLEKDAREIGELGKLLYESLAKTQDDLVKVGSHLGKAVSSFNDFAKTYDGHVLSRGRRLAEKHVKIGKRQISEDVPLVESAPRYTGSEVEEPAPIKLVEGNRQAGAGENG